MRLTRGEGWWLVRRRMTWNQTDMAVSQCISEDRYRRWELDREAAPMPVMFGRPTLTPGEWCALNRRRWGWTMAEAAERAGISRMTMWKAEHDQTAGVGAVRRFYERLGHARASTAAPVRVRDPE